MEAVEKTLAYQVVPGFHAKPLKEDKHKDKAAGETQSDESNYVDLDVKPDCAKTVRVSFTGEGNQLSVVKCEGSRQNECHHLGREVSAETQLEDKWVTVPGPVLETVTKVDNADWDSENERQQRVETMSGGGSESAFSETDEPHYTDMYLNSKAESDDGASSSSNSSSSGTALSDHCGSETVEDESHYITTHEIQLTELDHDVDYDLGRGTCWDFEDNNLVYSFVDYAPFESEDAQEGILILERRSQAKVQSKLDGAFGSTEQEDSDLCDSDKCGSSDEGADKNQSGEPSSVGEIHLSIKATSRAVNEPVSIFESSSNKFGDRGQLAFVSSGARPVPFCDRAQYFIPAPGRQHLASKLRRKDIEYSSGASSSISELDDADKEVRNLTAKSFRSLACPYFDAINLSTSSESSVSEYGLNKWSAFVDWNYGNLSRARERSLVAHKTSSATLEVSKVAKSQRRETLAGDTKATQTQTDALRERMDSQRSSSSSRDIALKDHPQQRGVTLNVCCNVAESDGARRLRCTKKARANQATGTVLARSGCEMKYHHSASMGGTHTRAVFASSLLKNVISKKMQFEQERKMERGEICDTYPALSPSFQLKDHDGMKDRGQGRSCQRRASECGSGVTVNSVEDQHSRSSSCEPAEELQSNKVPNDLETSQPEPVKAELGHSQCSAFDLLKEDERKAFQEVEPTSVGDMQAATMEGLDTSSMLTKLLFVPSIQLRPKEKGLSGDLPSSVPAASGPPEAHASEKMFKASREDNEKGAKTPEIKICLRSVKENKGCTLNIANLLTPKISGNTVNTLRGAGDAKYHIMSISDKAPNFTVRDIRDTKCKFQAPIYHVRDVRKLVKSSYRFVSLDNTESKCSAAAEKPEEKAMTEPVKQPSPSPIVIKCHSVNTKQQTVDASQKEATLPEASQGEHVQMHCSVSRPPTVISKQANPDQFENQPSGESKLVKQRLEKFEAAERRNEPTVPKQAALEKLKAAVKTMEQLYVFDRNEWKRKTQAPRPVTDSHVLSLITREEQGSEEVDSVDRSPQSFATDARKPPEDKEVPLAPERLSTKQTFSNKSILQVGNQAQVSIKSVKSPVPQNSVLQTSLTMKSSKAPLAPLSVKIEPRKSKQVEQGKIKIIPTNLPTAQACSDSENYLTIPRTVSTNETKQSNQDSAPREVDSEVKKIGTPEPKMSPLIMEYPASSIYHHPGMIAARQQVLCLSPTAVAASPTSSAGEIAQQTQRKMLLDPTTGHYYLVDTPIQPATKRLFDPETGQYVDVPMPHSPVTPVSSVTPVPLSMSPLALNPGAFAPTYMFYPSIIPSPTLSAQSLLMQPQGIPGDTVRETVKTHQQDTATTGSESAYYSATADRPLQQPVSLGHVTTRGTTPNSNRKPVISITTQQGPRIIAPPSFDGTTMSFVVEHR